MPVNYPPGYAWPIPAAVYLMSVGEEGRPNFRGALNGMAMMALADALFGWLP